MGANSPDPIVSGTLFVTDQALTYSWQSGRVPDPRMQNGINVGAARFLDFIETVAGFDD